MLFVKLALSLGSLGADASHHCSQIVAVELTLSCYYFRAFRHELHAEPSKLPVIGSRPSAARASSARDDIVWGSAQWKHAEGQQSIPE